MEQFLFAHIKKVIKSYKNKLIFIFICGIIPNGIEIHTFMDLIVGAVYNSDN